MKRRTQLDKDNSWLPEAKGKTVKVVAQLLAYLPTITGIFLSHYIYGERY